MNILNKMFLILTLIMIYVGQSSAQWVLKNHSYSYTVSSFARSGTKIFAAVGGSSVLLSSDGGVTWNLVNAGLPINDITILAASPFGISGTNLFVGTWDKGIYRTTNDGAQWSAVNTGLLDSNIITIFSAPTKGGEATAILAGTYTAGVFLSTNNGDNWKAMNNGVTNLDIRSLLIDETYFYAGTLDGLFRSSDNGSTWIPINNGLATSMVTSLARNGKYLFAGFSDGGIFRSKDNGVTWMDIDNGLYPRGITALAVGADSGVPGNSKIFLATWDGGVYYSVTNGGLWIAADDGMTDSYVCSFVISGNLLFAGCADGSIWARPLSDFSAPIHTTWTVTNTESSGTGSLELAIKQADGHAGPDTIKFAIPQDDPRFNLSSGTWRIRPTSILEISDDDLLIDGFSQAAWQGWKQNPFGPDIEIRGEDIQNNSIFYIHGSRVEIRDVTINNSTGSGIRFEGVDGGAVFGCYVGTTVDGVKAAPNRWGIEIFGKSRHVQIGASQNPLYSNLISGNTEGIYINDGCTNIGVIGNRIGTDRTETDTLGNNDTGIWIQQCDSINIFDNIIGGNGMGIYLWEVSHSKIETNYIGTDDNWLYNIGNKYYGIVLHNASCRNYISENYIGNNSKDGILLFDSLSFDNTITKNLISLNGFCGIRNCSGSNRHVSPPTILSVTNTQISGTTEPGYTVEVFEDSSHQGRYFKGTAVADTHGAFMISLTSSINRDYVTATATDLMGNTSEFGGWTTTDVHSTDEQTMPKSYALLQNYPNPFNPSTTIEFQIPKSGHVKLNVYNLLGEEVKILVNEEMKPGSYKSIFDGSSLASGVYLYRIQANGFVQSKKFVLLK
jgi:parallel beta-helix repeat protein